MLNGKIYTVGGFIGSVHRDGQNAAYEYDPASDTWRILPLMKAGRGSVGVAALDGKIHAIGGRNRPTTRWSRPTRSSIPRPTRWKQLAPLPLARDHTAAVAADGKIHVIGGRTGASTETTTSTTSTIPQPTPGRPDRRCRRRAAGSPPRSTRTCSLVLGGELPPNTFAQNEAYDPKTNAWHTLAPMPAGRHGTGAAVSGDSVYVAAGSLRPGSGGVTNELIVFTLP